MFRTAYGPRFRVSQAFDPEESRVASEFAAECDVNVILKKYASTGVISSVNRRPPMFGDFSHMPSDFLEATLVVHRARDSFFGLSSAIRKRFDNDPVKFVQFISDERNREEAISLGLVSADLPSSEPVGDDPAPTPPKKSKASTEAENPA